MNEILKRLSDYEENKLASYGMKSALSRGRLYSEPEHGYRTCFQRDKDRIVHSVAFRRLEYKTQVFLNQVGDHYRTRLTHSLEVSGLARTVSRALGLNEDLTEAVSLAHDLGHTPFGHAGERVLNSLMKPHGGFEHNGQAIRIVTYLESRSPSYRGLNLTYETRECMLKHSQYAKVSDEYFPEESPLLESMVVDICDEIAYDNHDLDDGLRSDLLTEEDLEPLVLWQKASREVEEKYGKLDRKLKRARVVSTIIGYMVDDLISTSLGSIESAGITDLASVRKCKTKLITFSSEMLALKKELEKHLFKRLYRNYKVNRMMFKAELCIEKLFDYFMNHEDSMPPEFQVITSECGLPRAVSDYLAGMTDRYAMQIFNELFT